MTSLADLLGQTEPLPLTTPIEDQEEDMDNQGPQGRRLAALIVLAVLAGIAVVIAGIALGGPWRWAGGGVAVLGIAAIVAPGITDNNEKEKKE
ncbi:hypothetical protein GCM10010528_23240 [Gordonia defluvii]|uniref:DUF3040 domain-containing protein n=1 Tax=Gordonia defluvii TaxID=283718 RepID=A0ABP6LIG5_9ACTN